MNGTEIPVKVKVQSMIDLMLRSYYGFDSFSSVSASEESRFI